MAGTKTFADMKKPGRRPTPDEIAAFEETGRAAVSVNTETREPVIEESRGHGNPETTISASLPSREHGNAPAQVPVDTGPRIVVDAAIRKAVDAETRVHGLVVRLTIDLEEPMHTRFKTACVMTKRRMVDEVRTFIERRTAELEGEAGRVL